MSGFRVARLLIAAGFLASAVAAAQQNQPLETTVTKSGIARVKVAIPDAISSVTATESAIEIVITLRDDLDFSGYFELVDPRLYGLVSAESEGDQRHDDWLSIGAEAVVELEVDDREGRLDVVARVYDNQSRSLLLNKRYGGSAELRRRIGHQLADDLVRQYTGQRGVALTRIAFVSNHSSELGDGKEIYLMDYDGRRVRRLTTTGTINLTPVWSPNGNELAFLSWRGRQPAVYAMTADGELGSLPTVGGELSIAPDWSPDGRRLVYSSDVADDNSELWILDRSTTKNSRITHHPSIDTAPAFSPNGREIAFTSDRSGRPQIYIASSEGLNVRRLSWGSSYSDSAAWSPQGDRLAYVSRIDGRFEIVVLDLTNDRTTRLTRGEGNNENPRWAPSGRHLVFSSDREGTYDIYTIRDDGSDVRRLTRNGNCFTPDWSR